MDMDDKQAGQIIAQAIAKAQARGSYELHESALIHKALTIWGPRMGLVAEQVPAQVEADPKPAPANE